MKKTIGATASALLLLVAATIQAATDKALGTLTVKGKTTTLTEVAASEQTDPVTASVKWLVVILSDRKVAEADRSIARLQEMTRDGKLHAVRILWRVGTDKVLAVPYDPAEPQSGLVSPDAPTINLRRFGSGILDAEFRSKSLGQDWSFHANLKAAVTTGGIFELENFAGQTSADTGSASGGGDKKVALGKLGYEFTESSFGHAVADGNVDAVHLFLELKMSPNAHKSSDVHPMILAAQLCSNDPATKPRSEVLQALASGGGDVKAKDQNGSTPLLWAVQTGCKPPAIAALLKAGADPNAKAKAGATPLMFAEMFQRTEIADMLRKAGAKK